MGFAKTKVHHPWDSRSSSCSQINIISTTISNQHCQNKGCITRASVEAQPTSPGQLDTRDRRLDTDSSWLGITPSACMRRPAASSQNNKETIMRRPCANGVKRRPAVYIMPILVKKGQSRMTTRGKQSSSKRRCYTRIAKSKFDRSRVHLTGMHTVTKLQGAKSIRRMLTSKGLLPVRKLCSKCGSRVRQDVYEPRCGDYGYRCPMDRVQLDSIDSRDIPYSIFPGADLR